MTYQQYASKIDRYELEGGYHLQRAESQEFTKYWVVYRNLNEDFAQSFTDTRQDLAGVPFCFWIMQDDKRIGGAVILPNGIGDFFLIPPTNDAKGILSAIMPLLETWSDAEKSISAQAVTSHYIGSFEAVGFHLVESRYWMIRPTEKLMTNWSDKWSFKPIDSTQIDAIAKLLTKAFIGAAGQYGARDYAAHRASVEQYFTNFDATDICGKASALVTERETDKLVGVCMVDMHKQIPAIRLIAVEPDYQRQGIAGNLIYHAINTLESQYDWIKLAVTIGSPAIHLYRKFGFISGDELSDLSKSAWK